MILLNDNFLEIKPMTQFSHIEQIFLNLDERKIVNLNVYNPVMEKKFSDMLIRYRKLYNVGLSGMVFEIITHPTEKSSSTKTIIHQLLYFNISDLKSDCEKIKEIIKKG